MSEHPPQEHDTQMEVNFSNSHEHTGDPEMHDHLGAGGLDHEPSEPCQGPLDADRTTNREHDIGSNNTPGQLLPELQMTQEYIEALRVAVLEDLGMEHNNINCLQKPEIVDSLKDPSPLLHSLQHFLN